MGSIDDESPLVSFIMGVYNTKSLDDLAASINSILNQTYKNIEIVICDDHSENGIWEFLQKNYGSTENITLIRNEKNMKLTYALNRCLQYVKGAYIARQDDDDYSEPDRIEKEMDFLEEHDSYAFVGTGVSVFHKNVVWETRLMKETPQKSDFRHGSQFAHPTVLFRRNALDSVNGYREDKLTYFKQDYDLFSRMYAAGLQGYNIQETLYSYRRNPNIKRESIGIAWAGVRLCLYIFKLLQFPVYYYLYCLKPLISWILPEAFKKSIRIKKR